MGSAKHETTHNLSCSSQVASDLRFCLGLLFGQIPSTAHYQPFTNNRHMARGYSDISAHAKNSEQALLPRTQWIKFCWRIPACSDLLVSDRKQKAMFDPASYVPLLLQLAVSVGYSASSFALTSLRWKTLISAQIFLNVWVAVELSLELFPSLLVFGNFLANFGSI